MYNIIKSIQVPNTFPVGR